MTPSLLFPSTVSFKIYIDDQGLKNDWIFHHNYNIIRSGIELNFLLTDGGTTYSMYNNPLKEYQVEKICVLGGLKKIFLILDMFHFNIIYVVYIIFKIYF